MKINAFSPYIQSIIASYASGSNKIQGGIYSYWKQQILAFSYVLMCIQFPCY